MPKKPYVIGLLMETTAYGFQSILLPSIAKTVRQYGHNLICFVGGSLKSSPGNPHEIQRNIIYDHIDPQFFSGLIFPGSITDFVSPNDFVRFVEKFSLKVPTISYNSMIDTVPSITINSVPGLKSILSHLIEHHGYRRFVYIGGPDRNAEAIQRESAFTSSMQDYGIQYENYLILKGDFLRHGGIDAAHELIRNNKLDYDAIVTANDETAFGVISVFREHGIRIPEDIAITGFDNVEGSALVTPPLTTVHQPIAEIGRQVVELLLRKIEGFEIPQQTTLEAPAIIRQSCGCFVHSGKSLRPLTINAEARSDGNLGILHKDILLKQLRSLGEVSKIISEKLIEELVDSFLDEMSLKRTDLFLPTINRIARNIVLAGEDSIYSQDLLFYIGDLLRHIPQANREHMQLRLHEAYLIFGEAIARARSLNSFQLEEKRSTLRKAGQSIANVYNLQHLSKTIASVLPDFGIHECHLAIYERECESFELARMVLTYVDDNVRPSDAQAFQCRKLIPDGFRSDKLYSLIMEPLFFEDERLGYILFEQGNCDGYVYEVLRENISGSLKGTLLMKQVTDQSAVLERTNEQLQVLRAKEQAYLQAIKSELELGRKIQSSFLPDHLPDIAGWEIANLFVPAREVSGDFYDAFALADGRVAFVIADVSGKDVSAALYMALIRSLIRSLTEQVYEMDPLASLTLTNKYILNHHHSGGNTHFMYATLFMAVLDPQSGELSYINAGHNPPALIAPDYGITDWLKPTAPAIGLATDSVFNRKKITIEKGETLVAYTDGVLDARNEASEFFTKDRFVGIVNKAAGKTTNIIGAVQAEIKAHCAEADPYDDITMLSIHRKVDSDYVN